MVWKQQDKLSRIVYSENEYFVKLKVIEDEFLSVKLFENTKLIREQRIKGKLKKGMFCLDNKFRECNGIPYVFQVARKIKEE